MEELEAASIKHIYREVNYCADVLTNDASISLRDLYIYLCIANLLYVDLIEVAYSGIVNSF